MSWAADSSDDVGVWVVRAGEATIWRCLQSDVAVSLQLRVGVRWAGRM